MFLLLVLAFCVLHEYYVPVGVAVFFDSGSYNNTMTPSRLCTAWKEENGIEVLDWPSRPPDINPIGSVGR